MGFQVVVSMLQVATYLNSIFILAKKEKSKPGLGETVILDLSKKLENTNCMLYFDNFFNSPTLIENILLWRSWRWPKKNGRYEKR